MGKHHPTCRPPRGALAPDGISGADPLRLGEDGKWRPDNGRPARAFIYGLRDADGNKEHRAAVANCKCPYLNGCPLGTALSKADDMGIAAIGVDRRPTKSVREQRAVKRRRKK